jgi:hypothetical protein
MAVQVYSHLVGGGGMPPRPQAWFMLNLDFFHAYDRVCMTYVDKVLAAFGFGQIFREVVATL